MTTVGTRSKGKAEPKLCLAAGRVPVPVYGNDVVLRPFSIATWKLMSLAGGTGVSRFRAVPLSMAAPVIVTELATGLPFSPRHELTESRSGGCCLLGDFLHALILCPELREHSVCGLNASSD